MGTPRSRAPAPLASSELGFSLRLLGRRQGGGQDPPTAGPADQQGQKKGGSRNHVTLAGSPADNRLQAMDPPVGWGGDPLRVRVPAQLQMPPVSPPQPGALPVKRRRAPESSSTDCGGECFMRPPGPLWGHASRTNIGRHAQGPGRRVAASAPPPAQAGGKNNGEERRRGEGVAGPKSRPTSPQCRPLPPPRTHRAHPAQQVRPPRPLRGSRIPGGRAP
ncbi:hypothetical protein NDU88_002587 [Pleurodeles waltl]|uniref:Uncharacterized protein n=1 Tax=Pleurodeles waltl TaxID=8319 RepID=A0AAV7UWL8_PLEWA|nr:hypothetical protein NDU88_002587 [Pleurodeles waltl]